MKHNKIIISILTIFIILLSVGCSNKQENIPDSNENVNADYDFLFQELEEKYDATLGIYALDTETNKEESNTIEESLYEEARNLFFNERNYEKTIEKANEIINQFPESYKAYNIRGIAKAYNGDFHEGMKDIDKALDLNSEFGYARFNKALNYELYGEYDNALTWYDKALEVEDYVWSYYGKASIYGRRGDVENTIKYLKIAISMDSSVKDEAKTESDFDNVRDSKEFQDLINN